VVQLEEVEVQVSKRACSQSVGLDCMCTPMVWVQRLVCVRTVRPCSAVHAAPLAVYMVAERTLLWIERTPLAAADGRGGRGSHGRLQVQAVPVRILLLLTVGYLPLNRRCMAL
jgi:hypothetical protein